MGLDYKSAGVDVEAGYKAVELIKGHVARTVRDEVVGGLGGFGGVFSIAKAKSMEDPVLVSGTDGVGTKLKIAFMLDRHDTVGIDCVAMCVNDIICLGAEPLFFLDYIACGKNNPEKIAEIVKGIAEGCILSGASLVGGETAEMPGFYSEQEYDLAGFCVGLLDRKQMIDGREIKEGDKLIGIASSGVHSNGFSLIRKVFSLTPENLHTYIESLSGALGEALITPTKIYVNAIKEITGKHRIKGISNITGGGFIENMPRMLPKDSGLCLKVEEGSWDVLPIFKLIMETGNITSQVMYNTFNMGIGMVLAADREEAGGIIESLHNLGEKAWVIGEVAQGQGIKIC